MPQRPEVIAFDVNETLSDLAPLTEQFTAAGLPAEMRTAWFASLLRDGFALAAARSHAKFADIGADVMRSLLHGRAGLTRSPDEIVDAVITAFTELSLHPDVEAGLRTLADAGVRMVTLTNGAASIGQGLIERAGLGDLFEAFLSVDEVGAWKPVARAYQLAIDRTGVAPAAVALVAVHPWDTDGAKRAGLTTAWISRDGGPYPSVFTRPDVTGADLSEVAERLLALG